MSYKLHEPEATTAFSPTGGGLFPNPALPLSLEVITVEEPQSRDEKLNRAISKLIPAALERRQGILVIQRAYGKYTVRVCHEVPCGTTQESRELVM
ncbi:hypothetical protein [Pseudarthrobacter sp. fls2-241-R2A-168]|uniref:hypothetical protein n=1 Tax=Pseudarthrobacter sp. fls2-241-R2A-168 TaxID=3040304 RepID=UPI002552919F|nr:hypothetical protein [Pseudarthrobacter sp. fls2-241-R2A-168]